MIDHLEIESTVLHKESEEAKIQMQREGANKLGEHQVTKTKCNFTKIWPF